MGGTVIGHRVNFAALGKSGFFAHDINNAAYWDVVQSPIVSYTPPYADIGVAQSYAAHFSQLGNSDGTIASDFEAVARLGLFLVASGVALGANTVALAAELRNLPFDRDAFANTIALPVNGINQGLAMIMEAAESAGQNAIDLSVRLSTSFVGLIQSLGVFASQVPGFITNTLVPFLTDTAQGIGNAVLDFLTDVPGTLFDLGRTLSFTDLNPFTSAYAQALEDRMLTSELRNALEAGQAIVQQAGQTVVVQQGIGPNPFETAGFNPAAAPLATGTVKEKSVNTFTAYLPYEARTGGQSVQLKLNGLGANTVTVLTGGQELTPVNGMVTLVIPKGQNQIQFALRAQTLSADVTVALVAQLVNGAGVATHLEHQATITAVNTPAINYLNGLSSQLYTGTEFDDLRDLLGSFNYEAYGNDGSDLIFSGSGHDQLYGDMGNDSLFGFSGHDQLYGGAGRDLLIADFRDDYVPPSGAVAGQDVVDGEADDDVVAGGEGTINCSAAPETIISGG